MKTPREVLLERHRSIEPRLDAMRRTVLANAVKPRISIASRLISEFSALRWHLAGMTAVWFVAALLHVEQSSTSPAPVIADASAHEKFVLALLENRRQLVEMTAAGSDVAQPAQPSAPRRRSERQHVTARA